MVLSCTQYLVNIINSVTLFHHSLQKPICIVLNNIFSLFKKSSKEKYSIDNFVGFLEGMEG